MKEPSKEFPKDSDPLWKALDAFPKVEPDPQSRARFWAQVAREDISETRFIGVRWVVRYVLPAVGVACAIVALYMGGHALIQRYEADREIAKNIELYQNYEVIKSMAQMASYEAPEEDPLEMME